MKCSFCGDEIKLGGGKMYIRRDGTAFYFCSNKCEKNVTERNRNPIKTRWTEAHHKLKKTMMASKETKKN